MAIIGTDNRVAQTNTICKPNRWLCLFNVNRHATSLVWTFRGGKLSLREETPSVKILPWNLGGTGCLISPRHVLTAAHVLSQFSDSKEHWKDGQPTLRLDGQNVTVTPGYNGSFPAIAPKKLMKPYGVFASGDLLLPRRYSLVIQDIVARFISEYDFALVDLRNNVDDLSPRYTRRFMLRGKMHKEKIQLPRLSFWGDTKEFEIRATTTQAIDGRDVFTIGYPTRKPNVKTRPNKLWMQWQAQGRVNNALKTPSEQKDYDPK